MVVLGTWKGRPVAISVRPNCLTVSVDHPAEASIFSYDLEGRLWAAFLDGISYRRGLNGRIIARWRSPDNRRERRWLPPDEALAVEERAHQTLVALYEAIRSGEAHLKTLLPPEGHTAFRRAIAFDTERSRADAKRYHEIYKPIGILPPDQYMAVVLQASEGCPFNTCTFCNFYRDRPFRIKRPDEFRAHAEAVREFLGAGLSLRRSIFLGDANALAIPMKRLLPLIEIVHEVYDVEGLGGIYAFLDGFSGEKKSQQDYAGLARRGLRRVYIGMESGNEALLRFLKKPGTPDDVIRAVQAIKAGGVAVGVIILLGAGGRQYAGAHIRDTIRVLNAMDLGRSDIIYFSELVVSEGLEYARDAHRVGLEPLTHQERIAQGEAIERGLKFSRQPDAPRISRYDIREFIY